MVALSDTIRLEDHARTERRQAPGAGSWKDIKDHLPGADKLGGIGRKQAQSSGRGTAESEDTMKAAEFKGITNMEAVAEQLAQMLMEFDKECNSYQTDVYLYVKEDGTAYLEEFVNVGGNSWLDDDHYTIYTDKEHFEEPLDWFGCPGEFADFLGIQWEAFYNNVKSWLYYWDQSIDAEDLGDDDYEIDLSECQEYAKSNPEILEKLTEAYNDYIEGMYSSVYIKMAWELIEKAREDLKDKKGHLNAIFGSGV